MSTLSCLTGCKGHAFPQGAATGHMRNSRCCPHKCITAAQRRRACFALWASFHQGNEHSPLPRWDVRIWAAAEDNPEQDTPAVISDEKTDQLNLFFFSRSLCPPAEHQHLHIMALYLGPSLSHHVQFPLLRTGLPRADSCVPKLPMTLYF